MATILYLSMLAFLPPALRFAEIDLLQRSPWLLSVEISERWGRGEREEESVLFPSAAMRPEGQWKEGLLGPLGSLLSVDLASLAGRTPILQPPASSPCL